MKFQIVLVSLLGLSLVCSAQSEPTATLTVPAKVMVQLQNVTPPPAPLKASGVGEIVRARFPLAIDYADLGAGWREITV